MRFAESTIYNFEVKEIGGDVVRAELIEYASATAFEVDYSNLHRFTGTVTAYNESRQAVAVGSFETGDNPACPPSPGGIPGNGGAGIEPVAPLPGNPEDPYNPLPTPGWPSGPGSTEIPPPPPTEGCIPKEKKEVAVVAGLTMMTVGCIVWFEGVFTPSTSKLSPHCNDGSGVIILPGTKPKTPCDQINEQREDQDFKDEVANLESKIDLKKETGYTNRSDGSSTYHDNASATDEKNSLALPLATESYNKNITYFMHTHVDDYWYTDSSGVYRPKQGIKIFSPADINYFMQLIANALEQGRPLDSVCGIMISSMNNYQIRFTGNQYQIKTFTPNQMTIFRVEFEKYMRYRKDKSHSLEFGFLKFLDEKMNLKGITLYRMNSNGSTTEVKLNNDKSDTSETACS